MGSGKIVSARIMSKALVVTFLTLLLCTLTAAAHVSRVYTSDAPVEIPDASSEIAALENSVTSMVTVTSELDAATCSDVILRVVVEHTAPSDLSLWLVTPDGQRVDVPQYVDLVSGGWFSVTLPGPSSIDGDWTLYISDTWAEDTGTLLEWNLALPYQDAIDSAEVKTVSMTSTTQINIPDCMSTDAGLAQSTIDLAEAVGSEARAVCARVDVTVDHTSPFDLSAFLVSPDGRQTALHDIDFTGSQTAYTVAPMGCRVAGPWTLLLFDSLEADTGSLHEWTLSVDYLTAPSSNLFVDAASLDIVAIPDHVPGEGVEEAVSVISVSDAPPDSVIAGTIVGYQVHHDYPSDLKVTLSRANAPEVVISDGFTVDKLSVFTREFDGMSPLGEWVLHVSDVAEGDAGELLYWSLQFLLDSELSTSSLSRLEELEQKVAEHEEHIAEHDRMLATASDQETSDGKSLALLMLLALFTMIIG